ncbi:hypothetical protein, partial [Streptomyces phytophilus]|uniref:hypothetical protein n=1 Tax=Streptomyces phytophilus TaxID=722715 RepID=UPI0015F02004
MSRRRLRVLSGALVATAALAGGAAPGAHAVHPVTTDRPGAAMSGSGSQDPEFAADIEAGFAASEAEMEAD